MHDFFGGVTLLNEWLGKTKIDRVTLVTTEQNGEINLLRVHSSNKRSSVLVFSIVFDFRSNE